MYGFKDFSVCSVLPVILRFDGQIRHFMLIGNPVRLEVNPNITGTKLDRRDVSIWKPKNHGQFSFPSELKNTSNNISEQLC